MRQRCANPALLPLSWYDIPLSERIVGEPGDAAAQGAVFSNIKIMPERVFLTLRESGKAAAAGAARMQLNLLGRASGSNWAE